MEVNYAFKSNFLYNCNMGRIDSTVHIVDRRNGFKIDMSRYWSASDRWVVRVVGHTPESD